MRDKDRHSFALLPCRSNQWIWISKPSQRSTEKCVCGRSDPTADLPAEGPTKDQLSKTIVFGGHPIEPMVDERGFADTGAGNYCNDIYILVCPCVIQESDT